MSANLATVANETFDWVRPEVHITNRELEVLVLLSKGLTTKEIAHQW